MKFYLFLPLIFLQQSHFAIDFSNKADKLSFMGIVRRNAFINDRINHPNEINSLLRASNKESLAQKIERISSEIYNDPTENKVLTYLEQSSNNDEKFKASIQSLRLQLIKENGPENYLLTEACHNMIRNQQSIKKIITHFCGNNQNSANLFLLPLINKLIACCEHILYFKTFKHLTLIKELLNDICKKIDCDSDEGNFTPIEMTYAQRKQLEKISNGFQFYLARLSPDSIHKETIQNNIKSIASAIRSEKIFPETIELYSRSLEELKLASQLEVEMRKANPNLNQIKQLQEKLHQNNNALTQMILNQEELYIEPNEDFYKTFAQNNNKSEQSKKVKKKNSNS